MLLDPQWCEKTLSMDILMMNRVTLLIDFLCGMSHHIICYHDNNQVLCS